MQIQVNTDNHIEGREALAAEVEATVAKALSHFSAHVTRVEVHLSDENGAKHGQHDKRCMMEARVEGRRPTAVTCEGVDPIVTLIFPGILLGRPALERHDHPAFEGPPRTCGHACPA